MTILKERYEIQRQLGKQTGRETLLARDLQTQEFVVIKLLSLGIGFDWQELKLFEREAETLKSLSHPAIPRYLDYLEWDRQFALVQTYVEGKTLEQHLKAGRTFSEAEVKELAKTLLEILIYLQQQEPPIVHRDIKPSNILLGDRAGNSIGKIHLVDFGSVAHLAAKEGGTITVVGTYGYMPPEQFGGRATPASDLYSLGATLIYLVTGLHPTELPQKNLRLEFQKRANIDAAFADWLAWMTEPSLELRLKSAREALEALETPQKFLKPSIYSKPIGSSLKLKKTRQFIEIVFPARGFGFGFIAALSLLMALSQWSYFTPLTDPSFNWAFWQMIFLTITSCIVIPIALFLLFYSFRQVSLRIDSRSMLLSYRLGKWKLWNFRVTLREQIVHITRSQGEVHHRTRSRLTLLVQPNLNNKVINFDRFATLSPVELDWLAAELSDWLGVPVVRS